MLERLQFMLACGKLKGKAAGVAVGGRCMPCRIIDAGWTGVAVSDIEDNTVLIPWSKVEWIEFGAACEEDFERRKRALALAKARRNELDSLIEAKEQAASDGRAGLPPEEIEAILRQFDGARQ